MSFGNTFETDILGLIFNGTGIAGIADNAASPIASLYVSLHTANPGEAGDQTASEAGYTNYGRVAVARSAGGWAVAGNSVSPASNIDFPIATGGSETITHVAIGAAATGAGKILAYGSLASGIAVADGTIPRITTDTTLTLD